MLKARGRTVRKAIWLTLAASLSSAAFASSSIVDCDDDADPLKVESVTHDSDLATQSSDEENVVRAALPGVSDADARIYRREMYRTDI